MQPEFKLDEYESEYADGTWRFSIEVNSDGTLTAQMRWEYEEIFTREKAIELRDFLNRHIKD